jgi:hypothetical protein
MTTEAMNYPVIYKGTRAAKAKTPAEVKKIVTIVTATDFDLTQAAAKGDMAAFEEIYQRHHRRVYSICCECCKMRTRPKT